MKYYILQQVETDLLFPVVFDEQLTHSVQAQAYIREPNPGKLKVRSAGFLRLKTDGTWQVPRGEKSRSLGMGPHKDDQSILTCFMKYGVSGLALQNLLSMVEIVDLKKKGE